MRHFFESEEVISNSIFLALEHKLLSFWRKIILKTRDQKIVTPENFGKFYFQLFMIVRFKSTFSATFGARKIGKRLLSSKWPKFLTIRRPLIDTDFLYWKENLVCWQFSMFLSNTVKLDYNKQLVASLILTMVRYKHLHLGSILCNTI
jgi:hypothetical protein